MIQRQHTSFLFLVVLLLLLLLLAVHAASITTQNQANQTSSSPPSSSIKTTSSTITSSTIVVNLEELGAIPNDKRADTVRHNSYLLQSTLNNYTSTSTNNVNVNVYASTYRYLHIIIPDSGTFYLDRGVHVQGLHDAIIEINGRLSFRYDTTHARNNETGTVHRPISCLTFLNTKNVTLTSSSATSGSIDGGGPKWWGIPYIGYIQRQEDRPYLLLVNHTEDMLIEHLLLQDAPYYTMKLSNVDGLEIHGVSIVNRRTRAMSHSFWDLSAFNTDGIDVDGHNVYVHDVDIWTQDDCIAVKDHGSGGDGISSNMTFERIHASGLGLVIGSIGGSTVRNITFRDSYLYKTVKGIYMKFRGPHYEGGRIEDVMFENITIESPLQWPIWIGPAQQVAGGSSNICSANPCSLCWPYIPFSSCKVGYESTFRNITLKDIRINNPRQSPGVLMGREDNVIDGLVMDSVVVQQTRTGLRNADIDLHRMFPGLEKASLHDKYVRNGRMILTVAAVLLFICVAGSCIRSYVVAQRQSEDDVVDEKNDLLGGYSYRQRTWSEEKKKYPVTLAAGRQLASDYVIPAILLMTCVIVGAFSIYYLLVTRKVHDLSHYYKCDHVKGRAIGSTWPVPSCLKDETIESSAGKLRNMEAIKQTLIVAAVLLSMSFPFCFKFTTRLLTGVRLSFFESLAYTPTPVYKLTVLEEEESDIADELETS